GKNDLICEAYLIFVALNDDGKLAKAIPVKPVSKSEKKFYTEALRRKQPLIKQKEKYCSNEKKL
ncbi:unnamed protein product, partial [marine sediment metagenome]